MRVPVALLALPYLAAAVLGLRFVDALPERLVFASAAAAVLTVVAGFGFFVEEEPPGVVLAIVLGGACSGLAAGQAHAREAERPGLLVWFERAGAAAEDVVTIEGVLTEDAAAGALALEVDVRRVTLPGGATLALRGGVRAFVGGAPGLVAVNAWRAGRTVRAPVLLRIPGSFGNPGVSDGRRALAWRGTVLTGTIKSAALVEVLQRAGPVKERAAAVRAWTRAVLQHHLGRRDPRSAAVATAILIGDRSGLSDEDERRLQDAGTYHVIAISGGNIAILAVLLLVAGRLLRLPAPLTPLLAIVALLFYGEIAGGAASVGRAITAAVVVLSALALDHRGSVLNVIAVAALGAAAVDPGTVLDAGFLLSFGATLGIVVGVPRLAAIRVEPGGRLPDRLRQRFRIAAWGTLAATFCAELALMPVAASFFSRVSVAGLLLNFIAIPLMTVVQCGAMALLAAAASFEALAPVLADLVHLAAFGLVESSRLVDIAPWLARDVAPPAWWLCGIYYGALLLAVAMGWRAAWAGVATATVVLVLGLPGATRGGVPARGADVLRVVVIDVGQGDAVLVSTPAGTEALIDAGGLAGSTFDIGSRVLLPALRALGVRRLDALVLTHGDPDHVGGAEVVIRRLRPAAVWEGVSVPRNEGLRRLGAVADAHGVLWRTVRPGMVERSGAVSFHVLHPPEPDWERQRVRNDDSVVVEVRYGDVSIVLPGDIGAATERALLPLLDLGRVVILKAAHHGSATSSSDPFIDAVQPAAVIFSAGRNNRFSHPAPVVVERFLRRGIEMFNTAADGAVFVETDGKEVEVWGWSSKRRLRVHRR